MVEAGQAFKWTFATLLILFIVYILVAGSITLVLYTRIGQGTKDGFWYKNRDNLKKYIFKSWIDWAGRPSTFSYASNSSVFYSTTYKALTGKNSVSDCMLQCESANERGKTPKCVGFEYYKTSNTCTLMSTMDGLVSEPGFTSNTIFFINGLDTARQIKVYESKTQAGVTFFDGNPITLASPTDDLKCVSNCASMSDCQGVMFSGSGTGAQATRTCGLVKEGLDPAKFTSASGPNIVYFKEHDPLSSSSLEYWTS